VKPEQDWTNVLADVPLFAGLSKRHLRKVSGLATARRHHPHTAIVRAGAKGDAFYVILDGTVSVNRPGKRSVKLGAGDSFGEMALLDGAARTATVEAEGEVLTMRIPRPSFLRMLEAEPKVAVALLRTLSERLRAEDSPTH
jgi:CRP-like cAMP-binding protein